MDDKIPTHMKALRLVKCNENYQLKDDVPVPTPGDGELLVRVKASSFCHTDYQVYQGVYGTQLPFTGSHEPAGVIAALGPNVSGDWAVGDRVGVLNFRDPCGSCAGCRWRLTKFGSLDARFCENKIMGGLAGADGDFAEYMIAVDYALVRLPDCLSFEQAAPLMCAGATSWNAIKQCQLKPGETLAVVGIGGLGVLAIQFAKALGLRVAAVDGSDVGTEIAANVPSHLKPEIICKLHDSDTVEKLVRFSDGMGVDAVITCTDDVSSTDWALHRLRYGGVGVVLGLPNNGFKFDPFNIVFRELIIRGSLHSSVHEVKRMVDVVAELGIRSKINKVPLQQGESLPERIAAHEFQGRVVVTL
ncbi:PKS-ER domain-containing protein [Fusarium sp. LHS14.1]|nr:PKS-ER domain-containing protein [Fusarium sp. LHS14.1]